jgi:hypothetical protein
VAVLLSNGPDDPIDKQTHILRSSLRSDPLLASLLPVMLLLSDMFAHNIYLLCIDESVAGLAVLIRRNDQGKEDPVDLPGSMLDMALFKELASASC